MPSTGTILRTSAERALSCVKFTIAILIIGQVASADDGEGAGERVNLPPVISGFDTGFTYTEHEPPVIMDANASISDSDSANFEGGVLVVRGNYYTPKNCFGIRNEGLGTNQIAFDGKNVRYGGLLIGTVQRPDTAELRVHFNASTTAAVATAVLRKLTFIDPRGDGGSHRTATVQICDGDLGFNNGYSNKQSNAISVIAVNDPPVINNFGEPVLYYVPGPAVRIAPEAVISDPDGMFRGTLTIEITANAQPTDRLGISDDSNIKFTGNVVRGPGGVAFGTVTGGKGQIPLAVTLNQWHGNWKILVRDIVWRCDTEKPSLKPRTISVKMTDDQGAESIVYRKHVFVIR